MLSIINIIRGFQPVIGTKVKFGCDMEYDFYVYNTAELLRDKPGYSQENALGNFIARVNKITSKTGFVYSACFHEFNKESYFPKIEGAK